MSCQRWAARTSLEAVIVFSVAIKVVCLVVDGVLWRSDLHGVGARRGGDGVARRAAGGRGLFAVVEVAMVLLGPVRCVGAVEDMSIFTGVAALAEAVDCE